MMTYVANLASTIALSLVLLGCAIGKDSNFSGACAGASPEAVSSHAAAFSDTLQPVLLSRGCNNCHDGSGKAPYAFAASDAENAVASALKLVNLDSPGDSRFISKVGNEMHQCGGNASSCMAIANEFKTQIEAWAAQTGTAEVPKCEAANIRLIAQPKRIISTDLSPTIGKVYLWDLNGQSAGLGKIGFQVEIVLTQAPGGSSTGTFTVKGPTVATAEKKLKVGSIRLIINGKVSPDYSNFAGVDYVVDSKPFDMNSPAWAFPWVSTSNQLIAWENASGDDVGFEVYVGPTEAPADAQSGSIACVRRDIFNAQILPLYSKSYGGQYCVTCHGSTTNTNVAASGAFNLFSTGDQCSESLRKSNLTTPGSSILLRKARDGSNGHPRLIPTADANTIISWIQAEADAH